MSLASSTGNAVAMGIGGVVAVLVVCAVFYAIGRGEDRDRATAPVAEAPVAEEPPEPAAEQAGPPHANTPRPRSPASAPRRRRP